ncbi:MAG: hypothetical protein ACYS8W_07855 [Planctomycetota bacterium]|jgi:hypothetical protein
MKRGIKHRPIIPTLVICALLALFAAHAGCGKKSSPDKIVQMSGTGTGSGTGTTTGIIPG